MRSYGILKFSRILTSEEALKRLSDIRLGINLGIIKDMTEMDVNEMILNIQPGNLQQYAGKLLNPDNRDSVRAEYVRNKMGEK